MSPTSPPPLPSRPRRRNRWSLPTLADLLWAVLGLELTVMGTLVTLVLPDRWPEQVIWWPLVVNWPWQPGYSFSLQVAAVLITGMVGGPFAGLGAQVAYLVLGLWYFPVFFEGGGLGYLNHPTMGYLLGFLPGAWLTGALALRQRSTLIGLMTSGLWGLLMIHLCGLVGLALHYGWDWSLIDAALRCSALPLLGQLLSLLGVSLAALGVRRLFFT
ncbi:biotin transporter BioY [Candidatus Cyanaurora vandensis]|uniref:biotin transporter BioY n=1 Tax=Candidatus Cyanaurora vandensis TaxID=2714958 RepID=UPI00257974EB|nr:biotin transporter BioY [Candidatus Cyanaurora vandensis]